MAERMTVMHLRASNFVGGPEKQILEHLRRIDTQRFRPILCSFGSSGSLNDFLKAGLSLNIRSLSLDSTFTCNPMQIWQLRRLLVENSVQLLVTHGYKPNIIGYWAVKNLGIPMIVYSHGWTGENARIRFYESMDRRVLKSVPFIVAVSEGHRRQILAFGIPGDAVSVIHNAVSIPEQAEPSEMRKRFGLPSDAVVVISAGRLSPEKNFSGFIAAAAPVISGRDRVYFVVLGEGVMRKELEQQIARAGLQERFLLPGFSSDVPALLAEADIFISSSHTEGLPVAVLEGAGAGLPVVATAVGGTPEVIRDGYNGLLVPPGDVVALRRSIERLLDNPEEARSMGRRGAALVKECFDFDQHARKLEALYLRTVRHVN